jgi:hypothetical protein
VSTALAASADRLVRIAREVVVFGFANKEKQYIPKLE